MATIISHPAVPLAVTVALGNKIIPIRLLVVGVLFSILPDLDVIAFKLGFPYGHVFGHRGFSHSIVFALAFSSVFVLFKKYFTVKPKIILLFLFLSMISHGIIDAMTTGGLGVGFFIPINDDRFFFFYRPISVSPIGIKNFLTERGFAVIKSEIIYLWSPLLTIAFLIFIVRKIFIRKSEK